MIMESKDDMLIKESVNIALAESLPPAVDAAVQKYVNGKIDKIAIHLKEQDETMEQLKVLLEDKKFLQQLWSVLKFLGGMVVSVGTAYLLFKRLLK